MAKLCRVVAKFVKLVGENFYSPAGGIEPPSDTHVTKKSRLYNLNITINRPKYRSSSIMCYY
jgi:hypothetical protein